MSSPVIACCVCGQTSGMQTGTKFGQPDWLKQLAVDVDVYA